MGREGWFLELRGEMAAGGSLDADGDHLVALAEAAVPPVAGEGLADHGHAAEAMRHVVGVLALEPRVVVPYIAAEALALAVAIDAFEAVDRLAVLEPLHHAAAVLLAARASAIPHRTILGIGMP